jgi:hypothetical protein
MIVDPSSRAKFEAAPRAGGARVMVALAISALAWLPACAPAADTVKTVAPAASKHAGDSLPANGRTSDDAWLRRIGVGKTKTARVCARGSRDRIATALCAEGVALRGLSDLYAALGLGDASHRFVAAATHSLGLSARYVSPAVPRAFVFNADAAPVPYDRFSVASFARGEQLVELVGLDANTLDYRFYLLRFEQGCDDTRCEPADLLTAQIEAGWTGWTLYADDELEDTPFDCISCHRPFGPGTPKQLLMRQTAAPWMHWGDFHGATETRLCPSPKWPAPGPWIPGDGLDVITRLEGPSGSYAGIPASELAAAPSGERFALFLTEAENTLRRDRVPADYPYAQLDFGSTEALCERLASGTSATWERQRAESLSRGLPIPYYAQDVLDPVARDELLADRAGLLAGRAPEAALDVATGWLGRDVPSAVGFLPRETDTAPELLRELCVRCHSATTEPRLARARFDAEHPEGIDQAVARTLRERISLPVTSPEHMPPWRTGELPSSAIARIGAYLDSH